MSNSICIYHNGNKNIISYYKNKFSNLKFVGNWAEFPYQDNSLYEISHADATYENLFELKKVNIKIIRHISDYDDDQKNIVNECHEQHYEQWLSESVINFLSFSDEIVCGTEFESGNNGKHAIITTGRTASTHLEMYLKKNYIEAFENAKNNIINDKDTVNSNSATFLWRENSWECLTSIWIGLQKQKFVHAYKKTPFNYEFGQVQEIPIAWLTNDWLNMCRYTMDSAIAYKFLLKKPINIQTHEEIIKNYKTNSIKIPYNKEKIIKNYYHTNEWYFQNLQPMIDRLYIDTTHLLS